MSFEDKEGDGEEESGDRHRNSRDYPEPEFEDEQEEEVIDEELVGLTQRNRHPYMTRFLLIIVILPSLTYCALAINDIFTRYSLSTQWLHVLAVIVGGCIATILCFRVDFLRSNLMLIFPVVVSVMLLPSYQVYRCSPLNLDNSDISKLFKLKTEATDMLEKIYLNSQCFQQTNVQAPYSLSFYTPTVNLTLNSRDVVALFAENSFPSDDGESFAGSEETVPEQTAADFFFVRSSRRVRGKNYKLYLLVKIPYYIDNVDDFRKAVKLFSNNKREKHFQITGLLKKLGRSGNSIVQQYSSKNYITRPVMFVAYSVTTVD